MSYADHRDDDYWRRANADWDRLIDKRISDLDWEIRKGFIEGRRLDSEVERLRDGLEADQAREEKAHDKDDYERETERLRGLSPEALADQFMADCENFAQWIERHQELPDITKTSVPKFLRWLKISHHEAAKGLQVYIDKIDRAIIGTRGNSAAHEYHLALYDLWHGMSYLKRVRREWERKKRQ